MIIFSISLTTKDRLDDKDISNWYHTVVKNLPEDLPIALHQANSETVLIARHNFQGHHYLVPLFRHLNEKEAEKVVTAFAEARPDLDFDIAMTTDDRLDGDEDIEIDPEKYNDLCTQWAKRQHDEWFKDRTENGWTYGANMSLSNKTHPLLRPWHELPDKFKKIDANEPKELLNMLNDHGYTVISQNELSAMLSLLRSFT